MATQRSGKKDLFSTGTKYKRKSNLSTAIYYQEIILLRQYQDNSSFQFGSGISSVGKTLLTVYAVIYVIELILEHWLHIPMVKLLKLHPLGSSDFHFWQLITHVFIHDPKNPFGFMINCLVFYFFASPVESAFGTRRFLTVFYLAALGGMIAGFLFSGVSGFNLPFSGIMPGILALIVIFGLLNPDATILLMFILPLKARYLSYGTLLITLLTFLAKANPHGAYHLGGILTGILYLKRPNFFSITHFKIRYFEWQVKKKKKKFTVINGGGGKKDDKPTIH